MRSRVEVTNQGSVGILLAVQNERASLPLVIHFQGEGKRRVFFDVRKGIDQKEKVCQADRAYEKRCCETSVRPAS